MLLRTTLLGFLLVFFVGAARAQTCNTAPAPATPAAPMTPAAPAAPVVPAPAFNAAGDKNLASGLVAYWRLDDASGTSAVDSVASNNGTLTNVGWSSGKLNGGANFTSTNGSINAPDAFYSDAFSVCAWIYPTSFTGDNQGIVIKRSAGNEWWFYASNATVTFLSWTGASNIVTRADSPAPATLNAWSHVCGVQQGAGKVSYVYVNGVPTTGSTQSSPSNDTTSLISIGSGAGITSRTFAGTIDEVGIWNRALSANEVATLYNGGSGNHYGGACGFDY